MLVYQKTMFDRYYCIKSFCHLKTLEKRSKKVHIFFFTIISDLYKVTAIMARKSMKNSKVLKTLVPGQRLTSS